MRGVLLINLGTPDAPDSNSVRRYLNEFLMDPDVIDIPYLLRWFLVKGCILPFRSSRSAQSYQKIWSDKGDSPLRFYSQKLKEKVQIFLGDEYQVELGMRYGQPSLEVALEKLFAAQPSLESLVIFPLYPQYSQAATDSSRKACQRIIKRKKRSIPIYWVPPFFGEEGFIHSFSKKIQESLAEYSYDHFLFSFHGLPERQIQKKISFGSPCLKNKFCCDELTEKNANCYRAQCFVTARMIAQKIQLSPENYTVCFQSRLGPTRWISPYTDHLYETLAARGVKRLVVASPSFVADCLETLEEIQIRGEEQFLRAGGESLKLVPSLNESDDWAKTVCKRVSQLMVSSVEVASTTQSR